MTLWNTRGKEWREKESSCSRRRRWCGPSTTGRSRGGLGERGGTEESGVFNVTKVCCFELSNACLAKALKLLDEARSRGRQSRQRKMQSLEGVLESQSFAGAASQDEHFPA